MPWILTRSRLNNMGMSDMPSLHFENKIDALRHAAIDCLSVNPTFPPTNLYKILTELDNTKSAIPTPADFCFTLDTGPATNKQLELTRRDCISDISRFKSALITFPVETQQLFYQEYPSI
jgi:hypothetical protein